MTMHSYFGSQWWCLSGKTISWLTDYLDRHPEYYRYMCGCLCPDESFFQTLVMASPNANNRKDYLHYVDWSEGKSSPKVLIDSDYDTVMQSGYLMARKFDFEKSVNLLKKVSENISATKFGEK